MDFIKWFYPGMHVKRWLFLIMGGVIIISLGFGYILREVYIHYTFPSFVYYITLQFIPRYARAALFFGIGVTGILMAILRLNKSLLSAYAPARPGDDKLVDIIYYQRHLKRGPKIVAVGGGTGLPMLLRGLKEYTGNLTAVVTVADDGGSSGVLRRELGVLPPGDFRNCIAALADAEPLMTKLFQYRFSQGSGLEGHSFGNLFILAMSGVMGTFERAIKESSRVLAVRGQILPSTLANITLSAQMEGEVRVQGESNIPSSGQRIKHVFLEPENVDAYPEAMQALMEADLIVLGPGSLYTSVLPNLLVTGIRNAIKASGAVKVYACNVATQKGETDGFTAADHVAALHAHCGEGLFHYVLANSRTDVSLPFESPVQMVLPGEGDFGGAQLVLADVVSADNTLRHDPKRLADSVMRLYYDRGAARRDNGSTEKAAAVYRAASG
ncbi:MAG: YvcK family protein [Chloroflexi bacterium]|nr:YvcK family protein [Chloroflexota bacterium]